MSFANNPWASISLPLDDSVLNFRAFPLTFTELALLLLQVKSSASTSILISAALLASAKSFSVFKVLTLLIDEALEASRLEMIGIFTFILFASTFLKLLTSVSMMSIPFSTLVVMYCCRLSSASTVTPKESACSSSTSKALFTLMPLNSPTLRVSVVILPLPVTDFPVVNWHDAKNSETKRATINFIK
ncbi:hypothetical protein D9M68_207950 [compost metagenome]